MRVRRGGPCRPPPGPGKDAAAARVRPFPDAHCVSCHDANTAKGGLGLTAPADWAKAGELARWVRVHDRVAKGEVPPGTRKPEAKETAAFVGDMARGLTAADAARKGTGAAAARYVEWHKGWGLDTPVLAREVYRYTHPARRGAARGR